MKKLNASLPFGVAVALILALSFVAGCSREKTSTSTPGAPAGKAAETAPSVPKPEPGAKLADPTAEVTPERAAAALVDAPAPKEVPVPAEIEAKVDALNTEVAQLYETRKSVTDAIQTRRYAVVEASPELKTKSVRAQAARAEMAQILDQAPEVVAAMSEVAQAQAAWQQVDAEMKEYIADRTPGKIRTCPKCGTAQELDHFLQHIRTARTAVAQQRGAMAAARVKVMESNERLVALRKEADALAKQVMDAQMADAEVRALAVREAQILNQISGLVSNRASVLKQAASEKPAARDSSS